mgnify:CR=1 FL=1
MILGLGSDLCNIERIQKSLDRFGDRFTNRVFTDVERAKAERRPFTKAGTYAKRFAAKEALAKALNAGHGLPWHDAEVINHESGKPDFLFRGEIAELIDGATVHLSLSHDAGIASAMVVVER